MSFVDTKEAARRLGCSRSTVTRRARALALGVRVGASLGFSAAEIERLRAAIQPSAGNPDWIAAGQAAARKGRRATGVPRETS